MKVHYAGYLKIIAIILAILFAVQFLCGRISWSLNVYVIHYHTLHWYCI